MSTHKGKNEGSSEDKANKAETAGFWYETNVPGSTLNLKDVKDVRSIDRVFPIRDWSANFPEFVITEF